MKTNVKRVSEERYSKIVAEIGAACTLGHKDQRMSARYAHLLPEKSERGDFYRGEGDYDNSTTVVEPEEGLHAATS